MVTTYDSETGTTSFDITEDTTVDTWADALTVVEEDAEVATEDIEELYEEEEEESTEDEDTATTDDSTTTVTIEIVIETSELIMNYRRKILVMMTQMILNLNSKLW